MTVFEHIKLFAKDHGKIDMPPSCFGMVKRSMFHSSNLVIGSMSRRHHREGGLCSSLIENNCPPPRSRVSTIICIWLSSKGVGLDKRDKELLKRLHNICYSY